MSRALFVRLRSLSSFSKKNSREFSGVLGALPLGEGVAENAVVELVETSAVGVQGETSPILEKIMRERYEEELRKLNTSIINMGKMIEIAIESSMLALMGRDVEAAKQVAKNDEVINDMERDIEALCMKLLLQQQPMATDLRLITAALKMITDMERIGDHAVDVADLVLNVPDCKYGKMNEIIELSTEIINMLHDAVQSYIEKDYNKAKNVIAHDDVIDNLYHAIKADLVQKIRETSEGETILDYLLIAKYIERIGDHATNIAEWVIFALTGERLK